mgnify:CR=1 FL=1
MAADLSLSSADLTVTLLDPAVDRSRLGPRFCAGGYIWQITDRSGRALLSGPEGPAPAPSPFNGHGLPESFRDRTRDGRPLTWRGERGLAPGAGILGRAPSGGPVIVVEPCAWTISGDTTRRSFRTAQVLADQSYTLERTVSITGRRVTSSTIFGNAGDAPLDLQWFAHPFFALGADHTLTATLPPGTQLPANPGFSFDATDATLRFTRPFVGVDDGQFELFTLPPDHTLETRLSHPAIEDGIRFATSFVPSECPVWANGHTFSIEPYQGLHLAPGETRRWTLTYDFGGPSAPISRG